MAPVVVSDPITTVLSGVVILICLAVLLTRKNTSIPGPFQWPIVGNTFEVLANRPRFLDWLVEQQRKYGDTFTFKMPFMDRFIAVTQPQDVEYILKTNFENYVKGHHFAEKFEEMLGHGIFAVDGDLWRAQRKTGSHMFSVNSFRHHMAEVFNRNGNKVMALLDAAAASGEVVDMQDIFFRFTLDSVGEISFGSSIGSLEDPTVPFSRAFDKAQSVVELRFWEPWWKLKRALNLTDEAHLKESCKVMGTFAAEIVQKRRQETAEQLAARGDLLSRFMEIRDAKGEPLTDKFLQDIIMNFMIAGRDTTANAMSWATYEMSKHPEVVARVRQELAEVPTETSYDELKGCRYLKAVISETLRLHPSVPKDGMQAVTNDTLPSGAPVKAGELVMFMPYVMGRTSSIWGEDCEEFKPERFFEQKEPSPFKFPAFKAGPRICLGRNMAYFESASLLSKIFAKYDVALAPGFQPEYMSTVTLPMVDGLKVQLKPVSA